MFGSVPTMFETERICKMSTEIAQWKVQFCLQSPDQSTYPYQIDAHASTRPPAMYPSSKSVKPVSPHVTPAPAPFPPDLILGEM
ncbi:hypothetical protein PoB_003711200 [Plakobranchus ocellatus]|uniref:Uncharacterized protein n=1 Tax=Plakobranchus ocellatus TaxID=259542 RepID=A0AAV4AUH3_9GAST|nr:hypothetical protein PoB_003711200 [Plakobranchus ocellatus]